MMKKQQICILGSTGSIGTQALDVIEQHSDLYEVYCLTANNRVMELAEQAHRFHPAAVVIANEAHYEKLKDLLSDEPDIKVYAGAQALCDIVEADPIDMVLASMVGFSGLEPTIHAIKARKKICLANKETLVVAGELICGLAQQYHAPILPVDSEHSAIFQSLVGEDDNEIDKILLTCSGGPFRNYTHEQLEKVTAADALKHPTWDMGAKITIDSASLMNKGFAAEPPPDAPPPSAPALVPLFTVLPTRLNWLRMAPATPGPANTMTRPMTAMIRTYSMIDWPRRLAALRATPPRGETAAACICGSLRSG